MSRECGRHMIDTCTKKVSTWNKQYLSVGGGFILVNSVPHDIPTYLMSSLYFKQLKRKSTPLGVIFSGRKCTKKRKMQIDRK